MSRSADAAVGMMDNAYFVGRVELLEFFNNLLDLQLAKIEQTASGAIACQLTEYIFPGSIPMSKVNWEAKSDYEFVNNYKLLQKAFSKHHVQRHVDVDKLIRAKYQDNLEFCQWLKAFYDQSGVVREEYDANAVRAKGKGGQKYNDMLQQQGARKPIRSIPATRGRGNARVTPSPVSTKPRPATSTSTAAPKPTATNPRVTSAVRTTTRPTPAMNAKSPLKASENRARHGTTQPKADPDAQLVKKNAELQSKIDELETTVLELEKERDFYFGKLRNIELMLQVKQDVNFEGCDLEGVVGNIFKVLYATAEEDVEVAEDGEIVPGRTEASTELLETLGNSVDESFGDPASEVETSVEQDAY